MKKDTVIRIFGGTMTLVAEALGCSRQAVQLWATDRYGDLTSPAICDAVLAAIVRENYRFRRAHPHGSIYEFDEQTLDDLLKRPERTKRAPPKNIPQRKRPRNGHEEVPQVEPEAA